jgi:hypothetical protein
MVENDDVDEKMKEEIKDEWRKYGKVERVII